MYKLGQTPTFSDNLLILKTSFFGIDYKSYDIEARTMFFSIAFRVFYSMNIVECIFRFRNVMGNMRRRLKIAVDVKKNYKKHNQNRKMYTTIYL